jgi:hypothetical protein
MSNLFAPKLAGAHRRWLAAWEEACESLLADPPADGTPGEIPQP